MNIVKINLTKNLLKSMDSFEASDYLAQNYSCLDLSQNQITNIPRWIFHMKWRTELYLKGNPFNCPCTVVKKFSQFYEVPLCIQLPNISVLSRSIFICFLMVQTLTVLMNQVTSMIFTIDMTVITTTSQRINFCSSL